MKRFFLMIVCVLAVAAMAAAPTNSLTSSNYLVDVESDVSHADGKDTIVSVDSFTIIDNWYPKQGWEYILVTSAQGGTGSDSAELIVYLDALDTDGDLLYRTAIDTTADAAVGEAIVVPVGQTVLGTKYRLKFMGDAGTGTQVIINNVMIMKRRAITTTKMTW